MTAAAGIAIDLDGVLGDTGPLWRDWLRSTGSLLGVDPASLPDDRADAAAELDRSGAGNWRALLERWSEERVAVYLRRDARVSSALRDLAEAGSEIGVFTDAPEPLARVALAQLGGERRVARLESGADALERLLSVLGPDATVVASRSELEAAAKRRSERGTQGPLSPKSEPR